MANTEQKLIEAVLTNDELSTDAELIQYFVGALVITKKEAEHIVDKRDYYFGKI